MTTRTSGGSTATRPIDRFLAADMFVRDIHPLLTEVRATTPVAEVELSVAPDSPPSRQYYVFSHALVRQVLSDPARFSSAAYAPGIRQFAGRTMLEMDPPAHTGYRGLIAPMLRSNVVSARFGDMVRTVVGDAVTRLRRATRAELLADLTLRVPVEVLRRLSGVPDTEVAFFRERALKLIDVDLDWPEVAAARTELADYFADLIAWRRARPVGDLISDLAAVRTPRELSTEEIVSFLILLIPAGIETTHRAAANLLLALFHHPEVHAQVRDDRSLIPNAMEEVLRWEPAVGGAVRIAKQDTSLDGVRIPVGAVVYTSFLAANRDHDQYTDPHRFDIARRGFQHVTYGHGPHLCIGMHLARFEVVTLMNHLFDRLPRLRLDPERPKPHFRGKIYRTPNRLPVVF